MDQETLIKNLDYILFIMYSRQGALQRGGICDADYEDMAHGGG